MRNKLTRGDEKLTIYVRHNDASKEADNMKRWFVTSNLRDWV